MQNSINGPPICQKRQIMITSLSRASKLCSTCAFWAGSRAVNPGGDVVIHPYSKGDCKGGGFNHMAMSAMSTCHKWELWSLMANHIY
jgi:hypothetical protein